MKTLSCISLIIAVLITIISIFMVYDEKSDCKSQIVALTEQYRELEEENDILYSFIENIDTYKDLDDAIQASEDLMDYLQFKDE